MNKTAAAGAGLLAALSLIACAGPAQEAAEPSGESSSVVTGASKDAWLGQARDGHLDDLESWHREYVDADCVAHVPRCHDLFAEGLPLMADYSYWIRNQTLDLPEYVPASHSDDVAAATRALVSWSYTCPDAEDCVEAALDAESRSSEVITEASAWAEE